MSGAIGTAAKIHIGIMSFVRTVVSKHPAGKKPQDKLVLQALLWDAIEAFAKGQAEDAWGVLEHDGIYIVPSRTVPSDKLVGVTPSFEIMGRVTDPAKRFNAGELAKLLKKSKYKIPEHETASFVDKAKIGENGNLYLSIVEKAAK